MVIFIKSQLLSSILPWGLNPIIQHFLHSLFQVIRGMTVSNLILCFGGINVMRTVSHDSMLEPGSKYIELNGSTADEYLKKARTMFVEMDLHWDLDELDKLMMAKA
jgi:hypothetical protein